MASRLGIKPRLVWGVVLVGLVALYWVLMETGVLSTLTNKQALREWKSQWASGGPRSE